MKATASILALIALTTQSLLANVTITPPTGGNNIPADKALNSTNGAAFTSISNIVITEGLTTDLAAGNNQTLILTVPPGWQFKPGTGTVTFTGSRDITAASIFVTSSNATITFSASGTSKLDTMTIGSLQVQALDGANTTGDYIRRVFENPGTAVIVGIDTDFTTFGLLNQVAGAARALKLQTQPAANANAGSLFSPQPAVQVLDQFGNLRNTDNTTVVTAARASGSGTLLGTLTRTAVFGVATYTNLSMNTAGTITIQFSATNVTSVTSAPVVVGPAAADRLVFATQPGSASAGVPFGIQPVIKTQDKFGSDSSAGLPVSQLVTVTLSSGTGTLLGTTTVDIGTAAGNGIFAFTDLQIGTAGTNKQLTATSIGLSNAVSAAFAVSSAVYSKLQLLMPGETAAPGTASGKTGTPNAQAAGTPFNVTINAVDASWNLVNTISDTVRLTSTDGNATLPANTALVSGTKTLSVTFNTVGSQTLTASDLTDGSKAANTSPATTVGGGTPRKLTFQTPPSSNPTAGVPFAPQPVIRVEDAGGNLVATDNGRVVTVARGTGTAALQGTLTATTVNGLATFTNLSYNLAETITLNFTASGLTSVTSGSLVVGTGPFSKLQLLVPGETAAPGTSTGKIGTPIGQTVGSSFYVSVRAVDSQWNLVNTANDTVGLNSSTANATLPAPAALAAGTTNLTITFNTNGNFTLTASDLADGTKTANTSPIIAVGPLLFTPATGGAAISADTIGGTYTPLTGPIYTELTNGNVGLGTIILSVPAGFMFSTSSPLPTVLINGSATKTLNINGVTNGTAAAMTSVTTTQLVFTVTKVSSNAACKLTWQNVKVRPTAGAPLATGKLSFAGTASLVSVSTNSNLGLLQEAPGAANKLSIQTQPSANAIAGVPFPQQPVVRVLDQFGNLRTNDSATVVTASRNAGSGTLQGTTAQTASSGLVSFTNLSHNIATNITILFSGPGLTNATSSVIAVSPATADRLVFVAQPGSATYGAALSSQPVLKSRDSFGNDSTVGLGASQIVSLSLSSGTGLLLGTTSRDIGTDAGNGIVSFSGLSVSMAGAGKQLSASAAGLTSALSTTFAINAAPLTGSITANSKVYDGTTAATIASRSLSGVFGSDDVSLSGGIATFATKSVGTAKIVTATGLGLIGADAGNYQLASTSASAPADITPRSLTVSATGVNKVYDGATSATVSLSDNRIAGDSLSSTYSSASFADKNVGTARPVSVSGIAISGTDAANYSANTTASTTANITARSLTVTAAGVNKVYDGNTDATVTLSDNRVAGDSLSTSYTAASFANKNAGAGKAVSVTGISVTGTDAGNYTVSSTASTTANITTKALTVSATGVNKVYDGTTAATVSLSDNRLAGDSFSAGYSSASFANKNVGTGKTVNVSGISLGGADAGNYAANTSANTSADITVRSLTINATGINKVYDGTTAATVTLSDNRVGGDSLATSYSASFGDGSVGTGKAVSVTGISISGTDAANYSANASANTTANITAASLTAVVSVSNKVYDGTTAAAIATRSLTGVQGSDDVSLTGGTASFATKTVGTNKTVSVTGLSLSGADAGNYQLASTNLSTAANISKAPLTLTATGVNKTYNGNTAATVTLSDNRLPGDSLTTTYTNASFVDKNVDTNKTVTVNGISISGADAGNYSANTTTSTTADITARSLIVSATGVNRVYDGTAAASVTLSDNRLAGDVLTATYTSASFADKIVGTAKPVSVSGISISGADAGNYSANTTASATANITAKGLTVSGITASNKIYDVTTSASVNTSNAALVEVIGGDDVIINSAGAAGTFADKNVGNNKLVSVSALSLSGADAANYTLAQPTTTASITKAGLIVSADDKTRAAGQANPTLTASYSGFVGSETLATSGVTGTPALSTTTTNVAGNYPITAAQGTLSAANYSFSFVNGVLTVTSASGSRLVIITQPSGSATAGVPFAQQPAIGIQDAYGNLRASDNTTVVTATRNAGSGSLQGTLTATAVNGVATFANLSHNVANTINLTFSSGSLTNVTSANLIVSPAAFTKLQLLVPGEVSAPGTVSGKTGTPGAQTASTSFGVTVSAVDAFWNLANTVTDTVALGSSDTTATLPPVVDLVSGMTNLTVFLNATGSFTLTATDLDDASKTASTSPAITVSPAQFALAAGGATISADGSTGTFTSLTGPTYSENASGNVGTGTIILNVPAGFIFDTGGTAPTVKLTSTSSRNNINGASSGSSLPMSSVTATQLTFTVTTPSSSGSLCTLTWQNVRVRPTAGTPLASGNLSRRGTASIVGLSTNANLGTLREVAGAAKALAMQTPPSASAIAGVAFAPQPVIQVRDQFGNLRSTANGVTDSTVVNAARGAGSGTLQGTLNVTATNGLATFINLSHTVATNITLAFSSSGLTGTNSSIIAVSPAAADHLAFTTQPGNGVVGLPLATQPCLRSCDQFGNNSTVGLGTSRAVSLTLGSGTGPLLGATVMDIGTNAGNGFVSCLGLGVDSAGTNKQLKASASGLSDATSSVFSVAKADQTISFSPLPDMTYGAPSFSPSATASSGLPITCSIVSGPATVAGSTVTITGAGTVTIRASQAGNSYWLPAAPVDRSFTVAKATLTVMADNKSRAYGAPNPGFTVSYSGFVNQDGSSVLSGAASLTTTATLSSSVAGNPYPVTVAQGTLNAANYSFTFVPGTLTVTPSPLSVIANNVSRLYGQPNPPFTGTLTGVRNGDNISASYATAAGASSPAGAYAIMPSLSDPNGKLTNYVVASSNGTLTVGKVTLTVTAQDQSRVYGAPNPPLTASYNGFVSGDDASVLSGNPAFSTTATSASAVAGGPYVISVSRGTLNALNYDFAFLNAQLTVSPASSANVVTSSANPSPTGVTVTLAATLAGVSPSTAVPAGTVRFISDGSPLGAPVTLSGGVASLSTPALTHGIHTIAAEYAGDGNFFGSTNTLGSNQVVNTQPLASMATYSRASNTWIEISIASFMTNYTTDADGDALTLLSVGSGTNGATVLIFGGSIYYLPSNTNSNRNSTDYLDYAITDGFPGGTATNQIQIKLDIPVTASPAILTSITGMGEVKLTFTGAPNHTYQIERSRELTSGWSSIGSATTDASGQGVFTDTNPPADHGFYRTMTVAP